jgi:hypothetical protein
MIEFPSFPLTYYHPVHGAVTVNTPEEAAQTFTVPTDWFKTAAEADAHRTEREAGMVIHNGVRGQITLHEEGERGVVMHSVTHQETNDQAVAAAQATAEADGAPVPEVNPATSGAELLPTMQPAKE